MTHSETEAPGALSIAMAAARLNLSRATLYRMHADDEIRFVKLRGRTVVPESEVSRLLDPDLMSDSETPEGVQVLEPVKAPRNRRIKKVKLIPHVIGI